MPNAGIGLATISPARSSQAIGTVSKITVPIEGWGGTGQLTIHLKWTNANFNTCVLILNCFLSLAINIFVVLTFMLWHKETIVTPKEPRNCRSGSRSHNVPRHKDCPKNNSSRISVCLVFFLISAIHLFLLNGSTKHIHDMQRTDVVCIGTIRICAVPSQSSLEGYSLYWYGCIYICKLNRSSHDVVYMNCIYEWGGPYVSGAFVT